MTPVVIGNATLYQGDCREVLPALGFDVVVTDPPWDQAKGIAGADDPRGLFAAVAPALATARMVAIQLGCYTDPAFCAPVAQRMDYFHTCWLRYVPPSYNGRVLVDADVAYVYGAPPSSREGRRVIPSQCEATQRDESEERFLRRHGRNRSSAQAAETKDRLDHPMARRLHHVQWLVRWHTEDSDTVADPFMGSGTTGVACVQTNRSFVGIEIEERFFDLACERIEQANRQGDIFYQSAETDALTGGSQETAV